MSLRNHKVVNRARERDKREFRCGNIVGVGEAAAAVRGEKRKKKKNKVGRVRLPVCG